MFNKPEIEKRKAILTIGDTEYCSINIKGSRTLTNTCIRLQDCMNKIAQWKRPICNYSSPVEMESVDS